ncbi:MAG: hypothetical protein HKP57_05805 [Halobacteria archaeon]|nr:hypothetical protein [Halobacteria archaeon]
MSVVSAIQRRVPGLYLLMMFLFAGHASAADLQLTGVSASPAAISGGPDEPVEISFHINQSGSVVLEIYDAYERLVFHTSSQAPLAAGDHALRWKGVDDRGKPVVPGAYYYVLKASTKDGSNVTYDLSDITGGKILNIDDIRYLADEGVVSYTVPATSRLFVRYGIEEHVMLGTLVNGKVHLPGEYRVPWKGYDASGRIRLAGHPKLEFFVHGMRLSRNAIIVKGAEPDRPVLTEPVDSADIRTPGLKPVGLNVHAYHKRHLCRDFAITLELVGRKLPAGDAVPVVNGRTRFQVAVAPEDQAVVQSQRFEIQFYLDNQMVYENEVSYTPYNWTWDMSRVPPGVHYLTAIVVGYGSHFGVSTMEFRIDG